MFFRLWG
jgi:hypothetical protein